MLVTQPVVLPRMMLQLVVLLRMTLQLVVLPLVRSLLSAPSCLVFVAA